MRDTTLSVLVDRWEVSVGVTRGSRKMQLRLAGPGGMAGSRKGSDDCRLNGLVLYRYGSGVSDNRRWRVS